MIAHHISSGMYGMILVEPEGGLSKVDHEFYVMQGEIYTEQAHGTPGLLTEGFDKLLAEQPGRRRRGGAGGRLLLQRLRPAGEFQEQLRGIELLGAPPVEIAAEQRELMAELVQELLLLAQFGEQLQAVVPEVLGIGGQRRERRWHRRSVNARPGRNVSARRRKRAAYAGATMSRRTV